MNWYEKLSQYFPIEEMKSRDHIEALLKERGDIYYKDESPKHVLMYAELDDFLFIDYIYVSKDARGEGLGHKLISRLKSKNKPILLEVEPVDESDEDTAKRLKFYQREGFHHASSIGYSRKSLATNVVNHMEILYWSPNDRPESEIFSAMKETYEKIHTYKDKEWYGRSYEDVSDVLKIRKEDEINNIFDEKS
ncbi:GNAT family N-acetyltransferase [Bacillus sp. FJAT-42376]|uniref:GNAT family N-acetyltransferase n=1 Tax=Bacillus sp. FJAT-42376 TaxID=2014076 RepID=UPI000F503C12|nr:GNAT family N-acetyltransferase [Bacillus sp. FJAT-42376]AZB42369.1 GNAT family N-acetyltransferase [Bacillus sp. FJAT-42376]